MIFGPLATLLAAVLTARCPHPLLAPLPPVLCNAVIVGAVVAFEQTGFTAALPASFLWNALSIGMSEAAVCFLLGGALLRALRRSRRFRGLQQNT